MCNTEASSMITQFFFISISNASQIVTSKAKPKTRNFKGGVHDGYTVTGCRRRDVRRSLHVGTVNKNKRTPLLKPTSRIQNKIFGQTSPLKGINGHTERKTAACSPRCSRVTRKARTAKVCKLFFFLEAVEDKRLFGKTAPKRACFGVRATKCEGAQE